MASAFCFIFTKDSKTVSFSKHENSELHSSLSGRSYIFQERQKCIVQWSNDIFQGNLNAAMSFHARKNKDCSGFHFKCLTMLLQFFHFLFRFLLIMNFRTVCIMSLPHSPSLGPSDLGGFQCSQPPTILRHDISVSKDFFSAK